MADKGGELSEEVSSCSSLLDDSSSGSSGASDHETTPVAKVKAKSKPEPVAKAKVKARELPPVKSSEEEEEASVEQDKGGAKKKARRSKADFPDVPPGEPAPRHRGKANAQGELYPGYRKGDPRRCACCEQLRRGFPSATKGHRAGCLWKVRK